MLHQNLDRNLIKKIEDYMFYDTQTMKKFNEEWKENLLFLRYDSTFVKKDFK